MTQEGGSELGGTRCGKTVHCGSTYLPQDGMRCQRERDHDGYCLFAERDFLADKQALEAKVADLEEGNWWEWQVATEERERRKKAEQQLRELVGAAKPVAARLSTVKDSTNGVIVSQEKLRDLGAVLRSLGAK